MEEQNTQPTEEELDLMNHATGHHTFDILDDNERSREIIRATLDFS